MIGKAGIYTLSAEAYHADPCPEPSLSASIANVLLQRSPAHARIQHPIADLRDLFFGQRHFDSTAHYIADRCAKIC